VEAVKLLASVTIRVEPEPGKEGVLVHYFGPVWEYAVDTASMDAGYNEHGFPVYLPGRSTITLSLPSREGLESFVLPALPVPPPKPEPLAKIKKHKKKKAKKHAADW
jgi:hypothetical protein